MEIRHAVRVCKVCSQRKKTCDKVLPSCGFCSNRGLPCSYDEPLQRERRTRNYNPGRFFVPVEDLEVRPKSRTPPADATALPTRSSQLTQSQPYQQPPARLEQPAQSISPALRHPLVEHVSYLLQQVGLGSPGEVSQRYHHLSHQWPRVVSQPASLALPHQQQQQYEQDMSVDVAVLHLAMALLVVFPDLPKTAPEGHPLRSKRSFYESVKSVYGLVQGSAGASLPLLQAGLLIATCEYASVRPAVAHVTLGSCRAMLQVLDHPVQGGGVAGDAKDWSNVRWTLSMLERIILCELLPRAIRPCTEDPVVLLERSRNDGGEPGRQAQAIVFLDQVLATIHLARENPEMAFPQLRELDVRMQTFLKVIMDEDANRRAASLPAPIPLTLRALFLLNECIAGYSRFSNAQLDDRTLCMSQATLGAVSRMAIDLVRYGTETWSTPICCYYNLEAAMEWFKEARGTVRNQPSADDVELLSNILHQFREKWTV